MIDLQSKISTGLSGLQRRGRDRPLGELTSDQCEWAAPGTIIATNAVDEDIDSFAFHHVESHESCAGEPALVIIAPEFELRKGAIQTTVTTRIDQWVRAASS